jgi:dynein regulatory complex protein 1
MEDILKIKTNAENIENDRRANEEKQKRDRGTKIQNEVIQSHKKNVEIDWNWQELEEKEDCKELAEDIEVQRAACAKIIDDKQGLINEFMEQLNSKDSQYMKAMQRMSLDIESLIESMMKQFEDMRSDYSDQLKQIE